MNKYPVYKDKNDNLYLVDEKKGYGIKLWSKDRSSMFKLKKLGYLTKTNRGLQIKVPSLILIPNNINKEILVFYPHIDFSKGVRISDESKCHLGKNRKQYNKSDPYIFSKSNKLYTHPGGSSRLFSISFKSNKVTINGMFEEIYFDNFREDQSGSLLDPRDRRSVHFPIKTEQYFFDSKGVIQTTKNP